MIEPKSLMPVMLDGGALPKTLTRLCQGSATLIVRMEALTIHEAAETTGWSPRMLRYVERVGLVEPARSAAGYRLYGPAELQRLRTLRELLEARELSLSDLAFASRLRHDPGLREATDAWLEAKAERPDDVPAAHWLRWEQEKHQRLLDAAALTATN
jgi:MerR family transcriptional regulator, copper efflux regulator